MKKETANIIKALEEKRKDNFKKQNLIVLGCIVLIIVISNFISRNNINEYYIKLIVIVVSILFVLAGVRSILLQLSTLKWQKTKCLILGKKVDKEFSVSEGFLMSFSFPIIYFRYSFNNKEYISNKYKIGTKYSTNSKKIKEQVNSFLVGHHYNCYVNPNQPEIAVLDRKLDWDVFIFDLTIAIILLAVLAFS